MTRLQSPMARVLWLLACASCSLPPPPPEPGDSGTGTGTGTDSGTGEAGTTGDVSECVDVRARAEELFATRCAGCHDHGSAKGGLGNITDLEALASSKDVVIGDAAASELYRRLEKGLMPPGGPAVADDDLAVVRAWIDGCAGGPADASLTEPPACEGNEAVALDDVLAAIRDDVVRLDPDAAQTTRYVVFSHLFGAGYCEEQLEGYRHALAKLLNHLSLDTDIHVPAAIDAARTIFRVDLRDYKWSAATWSAITDRDPYRIDFASDDAAAQIQTLTGAQFFLIRGDWFIDAGSQPPLYPQILGLPDDLATLELELGIDRAGNIADEVQFDDDDVVRIGFQDSGVSEFNRVIERHQLAGAASGYYWLSYDFASNIGVKSILFDPVNLKPDGGEIIFSLPNGLQGYMIVDANGKRLDRAPIGVVHDRETPEEPEVITGLSCMSCHVDGMRPGVDDVRGYVDGNSLFDALQREQIFNLYPPQEVGAAALERDTNSFRSAMQATGAAGFVEGTTRNLEPVMAAHLAFERPLDLRRAAAELFLSEDELRKHLSELAGLDRVDRETVDRETFEATFQINACALNLGDPSVCP
jgi:serine/threonine-protein kinase